MRKINQSTKDLSLLLVSAYLWKSQWIWTERFPIPGKCLIQPRYIIVWKKVKVLSPFAWRPDFLVAPREAHWPRHRTSWESAHWGRRSRTTPRLPRHREMRAFSSSGGILELRRGIQDASCVGPGKSNLPFELRRKAGDCSRVTAGPIDLI